MNTHQKSGDIQIRSENSDDHKAIFHINSQAFETDAEAILVDRLRKICPDVISLVAEIGEQIVGHIFFSPVLLDVEIGHYDLMGLAPMAVLPEMQRKGVGSLLVKEGIRVCHEAGYHGIVVLGHPNYYPRFGFVPSVQYGIRSEYDVPDETFMVLEFDTGGINHYNDAIIKFHPVFKEV